MKPASRRFLSGALLTSLVTAAIVPALTPANALEPIGDVTTYARAMQLLDIIESSDNVVGQLASAAPACAPAALEQADRDKIVNSLNAMRELAGVLPVEQLPAADARWEHAAKTSNVLSLRNVLAHNIPNSWECFSPEANDAAKGMLSAASTAAHVRNLIDDEGVPDLGHRIMLLNPRMTKTAAGVVNNPASPYQSFATVLTANGFPQFSDLGGGNAAPIVAWPGAGAFPVELLPFNDNVRKPWSFSSEQLDAANAVVTVTHNGQDYKPVVVNSTYGGHKVIAFDPFAPGGLPEPNKNPAYGTFVDYKVRVESAGKTWEYPVNVFRLDAITPVTFSLDSDMLQGVDAGDPVTLSTDITGKPAFTYRLEKQAAGTNTWTVHTPQTTDPVQDVHAAIDLQPSDFADNDKFRFVAVQDGQEFYSGIVTIKVVVTAPGQKPTVTVDPVDVTLELGAPLPNLLDGVSAADDQGAAIPNIDVIGQIDTAALDTPQTITYQATDSAGRVGTATRTYVIKDTVAPQLALTEPNIVVELGDAAPNLLDKVTVTDADDKTTITPDVVAVDTAVAGVYTVRYVATDRSGNVSNIVTRTYEVKDTVAPVINVPAGDVEVEVGAAAPNVLDGVTVEDKDSTVQVVANPNMIDTSVEGVHTVEYTAVDSAGNKAAPVTRTYRVVKAATNPVVPNPGAPTPIAPVTPANPGTPGAAAPGSSGQNGSQSGTQTTANNSSKLAATGEAAGSGMLLLFGCMAAATGAALISRRARKG